MAQPNHQLYIWSSIRLFPNQRSSPRTKKKKNQTNTSLSKNNPSDQRRRKRRAEHVSLFFSSFPPKGARAIRISTAQMARIHRSRLHHLLATGSLLSSAGIRKRKRYVWASTSHHEKASPPNFITRSFVFLSRFPHAHISTDLAPFAFRLGSLPLSGRKSSFSGKMTRDIRVAASANISAFQGRSCLTKGGVGLSTCSKG